jgi:hypothetical protein
MDSTGEGVEYSSQAEQWDAPGVTIMSWIYVVNAKAGSGTATDTGLLAIRGASILYLREMKMSLYTGNSQVWTSNTVISVGTWHHFALVRDTGNVWRTYLDGVANAYGANLVLPTDNPHPFFGNDGYGDWLDGRVYAGKIWTATLSQAEIQAETNSVAPVRTANIWSVVPMYVHTDLTDQSGLGNTPTAMGSLSTEDGPRIGPVKSVITMETLRVGTIIIRP